MRLSRTIAICALSLMLSMPGWAEVIQLRNGGTIVGRVIERTPNTYRIELSPGAVITLTSEEVRQVEKVVLSDEIPTLDIKLDDVLPKPKPKPAAEMTAATYVSKLDNQKSLDQLIAEGNGIPRLEHPPQVEEARQRGIEIIRFMGQTFYLDPQGRYMPKRSKFGSAAPPQKRQQQQLNPFELYANQPQYPVEEAGSAQSGNQPRAPGRYPNPPR